LKRLLVFPLLAIFCCVWADSKVISPVPPGAYAARMDDGDAHLYVELTCFTDSTCTTRTISESPGTPPHDAAHKLEQIVRLERPSEAIIGALRLAVENRDKPVTDRDGAIFMTAARAMLSASPEITGCWDLNDPTPAYTLVCTVRTAASKTEQLVMFVAMVMDCHDGMGFCGYVPIPLKQSTAPGSFDPPPRAQWEDAGNDEDGRSAFHVDDERGDRLTMSCIFGQPQTCVWTVTVGATCPGSAPVDGLITSPAGRFRVKASCDAALFGGHGTTYRLGDNQDVDRSILLDGLWEIALDAKSGLPPMRFNTTDGVRFLRMISGCNSWRDPRCERNLPAEFRPSGR
jgi:hypothetical protein